MELFEEEFPYRGSKVIARAWVDAAFRKRLLEDGKGVRRDGHRPRGRPPYRGGKHALTCTT